MTSDEIRTISEDSEAYPPLLREIKQPPHQLFVRGTIELLRQEPMLAVVGSRKASSYGKSCVEKLLNSLVHAGVPLVSGLAYGIDAAAHRLCVENSQPTIAVLGSGIDDESIYPKINIKLVYDILDSGGAVVSEYEPGTAPYLGYFPARNRIIAGLTTATLVIQAAARSGSLITARLALESGRDVWAVPGAINDPLAEGTNNLIKDGATPITTPEDILSLFGFNLSHPDKGRQLSMSDEQHKIFEVISHEPTHIDDVAQATNLPAPIIAAELLQLELAGIVTNSGGMKYAKK